MVKFKDWLISEEYEALSASIPMPDEIGVLSRVFNYFGAKLFAVGGAIRDYLHHKFHSKDFSGYSPKDIDLATDQPPQQVIKILNSNEAKKEGIRVFEKGESFGVISAIVNGKEFEIATFRKDYYDAITGDGRRPDSVSYSNAKEDAKRRDLYINALFYDLHGNEIRDYNTDEEGKGQGLIDIANNKVRVVGDPFERFKEDKLRILRLVRFFSRLNSDAITKHLDARTLSAVDNFKNLSGVSKERISNEFLSGLKTCKDVKSYMLNFKELDLLNVIFPELKIIIDDNLNKTRDTVAIMAYCLKQNDPEKTRESLNQLKYKNEISDLVSFILKVTYEINSSNIIKFLRIKDNLKENQKYSCLEFAKINKTISKMFHFLNYKISVNSQNYTHLSGREISKQMGEDEYKKFVSKEE